MELIEYKIERWDVVYDERTNIKRPILYIVPDKSLIEFATINVDSLYITMSGTGVECYDGIKLKANLVSSAIYPNNRPNFFDSTGYYVIVLKDTIWLGYPNMLGRVGFEGKVNLVKEIPTPTATTNPEPTATSNPEPTQTSNPEPTPTSNPEPTPTSNQIIEGFFDLSKSCSKTNLFLGILVVLFILLFVSRIIINRK
jgi:hypothetical protein